MWLGLLSGLAVAGWARVCILWLELDDTRAHAHAWASSFQRRGHVVLRPGPPDLDLAKTLAKTQPVPTRLAGPVTRRLTGTFPRFRLPDEELVRSLTEPIPLERRLGLGKRIAKAVISAICSTLQIVRNWLKL